MPRPTDVYDGAGELIGHILGLDLSQHRGTTLSFCLGIGLSIALDKAYRNRTIDRARLRHSDELARVMEHYEIPPDAERFDSATDLSVTFRWVVLKVDDLEVSELLFDDSAFVPAGKRCSASAAEGRWWMEQEYRRGFGTTISADKIISGSITADKIGPGTVTLPYIDEAAMITKEQIESLRGLPSWSTKTMAMGYSSITTEGPFTSTEVRAAQIEAAKRLKASQDRMILDAMREMRKR